jgi:hypothetical protein
VLFFLKWAPRHGGIWGSGGIAPRILDLGTRRSGQLHVPVALPPSPHMESLWYPLDRRLRGPQSRSGRDGKEFWRIVGKETAV